MGVDRPILCILCTKAQGARNSCEFTLDYASVSGLRRLQFLPHNFLFSFSVFLRPGLRIGVTCIDCLPTCLVLYLEPYHIIFGSDAKFLQMLDFIGLGEEYQTSYETSIDLPKPSVQNLMLTAAV